MQNGSANKTAGSSVGDGNGRHKRTDQGEGRDQQVESALDSFRRILRALRVAAGEARLHFAVSPAQLYVLNELNAAGRPLSLTELATGTMTDRTSVAELVDRLVQKGYVTRERSARDRRRAEVRITESGEALVRTAPQAPSHLLIEGLRQLPETQLSALAASLGILVDRMGAGHAGLLFENDSTVLS